MKPCIQTSLFADIVDAPVLVKPVGKIKDNGKRKTKGWKPKVEPVLRQDALGLETLPLNTYDWGEDYLLMHEKLLTESLAPCLRGNVSMAYLHDIITWVIAPLFKDDSDQIQPFSFQACCIACEVDASEMRGELFPQLQQAQDNAMKN